MNEFPRTLAHSSGAVMLLDSRRLLLAFRDDQSPEKLHEELRELGFVLEDAQTHEKETTRPMEVVNHTPRRFWIRALQSTPISQDLLEKLRSLLADRLEWIGPVYQMPDQRGRRSMLCPLPNVLVLRPLPHLTPEQLRALTQVLQRLGLREIPERSRYLAGFHYYVLAEANEVNVYALQSRLLEQEGRHLQAVRLETMPMIVPTAVEPNDPLYPNQWNMERIQAGGPGFTGWDITTGDASVVVAVLDEGVDLTHPDLQFSTPGINLGTMMPDGSPTGNHGTPCAGIVAATFNNSLGVAGVAGNARIMPLAVQTWSDVEIAAGINFAADNGARVISMSFGWDPWDHAIIDPAIQHAFDSDVVMAVATHNHNSTITYPATNPLVIAVGASDQIDNRKTPMSPDGEGWGSNFGPAISVVAPGVLIPSTDRQGAAGYNNAAGTAGDYVLNFNGTSSATPQVAGLAALLRSEYPTLTNVQVRRIIERTAEKVGVVAYAETAGYLNGTWNQEMGYGRINVLRALDLGDAMIRDYPGDTGVEPSTPPSGNFWTFSDIVVRIFDDEVFVPSDPSKSSNVERGQTNYLYIRVTNNGPREARNVLVNARITPWVGLQFVYPADWTLIDAMHVSPTPVTATFAAIASGASAMAKFTIASDQVETLWGWVSDHPWHPCLLASVVADNDYAFQTANLTGGSLVVRRNNLAQRNLSVIDVLANATAVFPFVAGNLRNPERAIEVVINRSGLPRTARLLLALDDDGRAFPRLPPPVDLPTGIQSPLCPSGSGGIVFLERTRIETTLGCCRGVLTLEKGSRFDCPPSVRPEVLDVRAAWSSWKGGGALSKFARILPSCAWPGSPTRYIPCRSTPPSRATRPRGSSLPWSPRSVMSGARR
jgi:hypothetical protein